MMRELSAWQAMSGDFRFGPVAGVPAAISDTAWAPWRSHQQTTHERSYQRAELRRI
jgi:hypothetical protein